jgi:xanthine dehydrogenase YagR molybdenum-binding subunit
MGNYASVVPGDGLSWSSRHLDECYRLGARRFGWSRRNPVPGEVTSADEHWLIGMGMATAICPASLFPAR